MLFICFSQHSMKRESLFTDKKLKEDLYIAQLRPSSSFRNCTVLNLGSSRLNSSLNWVPYMEVHVLFLITIIYFYPRNSRLGRFLP